MLTVVQQQQQLAVPYAGQQDLQRPSRGLLPQLQRFHHRAGHHCSIPDLSEFDPPGAVRETTSEVRRNPNTQSGLTDAAGTDQADQTGAGQRLPKLGELSAASHEAFRLRGKVP